MLLLEHELIQKVLPSIGTDAYAVLSAIASHFGKDGLTVAWPGHERLCKMCQVEIAGELKDMPEKRMYKAIRRLIDAGLAERFQERKPNGDWDLRKFRLTTELLKVFMSASSFSMSGNGLDEFDQTRDESDRRLGKYGLAINDRTEYTSKKGSVRKKRETLKEEDTGPDIPLADPVADLQKSIEWQKDGEKRFMAARDRIFAYFKEDPTRWTHTCNTAKVKLSKKDFIAALEDWLKYHQDDYTVMTNPIPKLVGGKQSFYSWLRQPWRKDSKEKKKQNTNNQPATYDGNAGR